MTRSDWRVVRLGEILVLGSGVSRPPDTIPEPDEFRRVPVYGGNGISGFSAISLVDKKTIAIGRVGEYCGSVHLVSPPAWITDNALYVKDWQERQSIDFIGYLLDNLNLARLRNKGGQPLISQGPIYALKVLLPSYEKQHAIALILGTWDRGIQQLADLIAAKVRFKRGLMQQLLTGKRRFPEFKDDWSLVRLREVTRECDGRNRGQYGADAVMGVTKAEGMVPMRERTIGADLGRYLVVRKNWFAYNPMRINIGSIARWHREEDAIVSPDYVVLRCKNEDEGGLFMDPDYLDHLRRSSAWEKFVTTAGNGSVRVRIYYSDLGRMKLCLPDMSEQRKIASFLNTFDQETDLLRRELDALKLQKRGLMQKLLRGDVRVELPEEAA